MAFETPGTGALEYFPCRYGRSKLQFRGPKRRLEGDYVAVLGGSETYGKFLARPYPALCEAALGRKVVNFGIMNAGLDVFMHDRSIRDSCARARLTVIQLGGAQNLSNQFYAVHPRRNDRFLRASADLKALYPDVDFTEVHFTRHLLAALRAKDPEAFATVEAELKQAWVARMKALIAEIESDVLLLWLAGHRPEMCSTCSACGRCAAHGADPLFVDRAMLDAVLPGTAGLVEVVVEADEIEAGRDGMVYAPLEEPAAREMLGAVAHEKAARALADRIAGLG